MRPLPRILSNALTIVSAVLCLAFAGLWVRSHRHVDYVQRAAIGRAGAPTRYRAALVAGGGARVTWAWASSDVRIELEREGWQWKTSAARPIAYAGRSPANRAGLAHEFDSGPNQSRRVITFPLWLPTALFAALPLAKAALYVRRRRRKVEGRCATCGYDLRATPERCPECGTVSPAAHHAPSA